MKREAVEAVFAEVECQRADRDPEQMEWKDAGDKADDERRESERKPDVGAMPQEDSDQGEPPGSFSRD
jgi:hypothetical protein